LNWNIIDKISQLEEIKEGSQHKKAIIFKHSSSCPISYAAKMRLDTPKWNVNLDEYDFYFLDLLRHRNISNAIAEKFKVHHESPQIIIIDKGEAIYDNSHLDISIQDTEEVLTA